MKNTFFILFFGKSEIHALTEHFVFYFLVQVKYMHIKNILYFLMALTEIHA